MSTSITKQNLIDTLFLIPARAGSQGIPRKNLKMINGKTLIEITINQALAVSEAKNIHLSSDSTEILKYAEKLKINSVLRTHKESSNNSDANTVVEHFINYLSIKKYSNIIIVYLQPTSPFRDSNLIRDCVALYQKHNLPIVTVRKVFDHPQKMITITNGKIRNYLSEFNATGNRQNLLELFIPSGSVYVFSVSDFIDNNCQIPIIDSIPVEVFGNSTIDIDTENDLLLAQKIGDEYEF